MKEPLQASALLEDILVKFCELLLVTQDWMSGCLELREIFHCL